MEGAEMVEGFVPAEVSTAEVSVGVTIGLLLLLVAIVCSLMASVMVQFTDVSNVTVGRPESSTVSAREVLEAALARAEKAGDVQVLISLPVARGLLRALDGDGGQP